MILAMVARRLAAERVLVWDVASAVNPGTFGLGDRRITSKGAGAYCNVRSSQALTGLAYVEMDVFPSGSGEVVAGGVVGRSWPVAETSYIGESASCAAVWLPNRTWYVDNAAVGTVAGSGSTLRAQIAVRVASRRVWVRLNGGAWRSGGDPAADTAPSASLSGSDPIYAAACVANMGSNVTIIAAVDHLDAPPAGFTAWG